MRIPNQRTQTLDDADTEPEPKEECLWELSSFVTSIDEFDFNNTANVESEWYINENVDLAYFSM